MRERERPFRQQRDAGPERHHRETKPDPVDERIDHDLEAGRLIAELDDGMHDVEIFAAIRRIATSVVGSSCLLKNHCAGYICRSPCRPSNTVKCPVTICFWPSCGDSTASLRTV